MSYCKKKFAVGIILYNPNQNDINYLNKLYAYFDHIYVYDNSKNNNNHLINKTYIYNYEGKNRGLAKGFNWFIDKSIENDTDYLLLLDQDSCFDLKKLQQFMNEIEKEQTSHNILIRACNTYPFGKEENNVINDIQVMSKAISSGSFLNIQLLKNDDIRYDENMFIDFVDDDFCIKAIKKGYQIVCYKRYSFPQQLGYIYKGRVCHNAIRHYYMIRDLGYLYEKYNSRFKCLIMLTRFLLHDLIICFFEDEKKRKFLMAIKGYFHYLKKVTGEYTS